jgi:hypothetical protein
MAKWTTEEYLEILRESLGAYRTASNKARRQMVKEIAEKVQKSARDTQQTPPDDLDQAIYFSHSVPVGL